MTEINTIYPRLSGRIRSQLHCDHPEPQHHDLEPCLEGDAEGLYDRLLHLESILEDKQFEFHPRMFRDDSDTRALYKEFTNITSKEFADCQERYTLRVVYNILSNPLKGKEDQLQAINAHFGVSASTAKRKEAVGFLRPLTQKLKASATYIPHRRTRPDLLSIYKNAAQLQFHKPDSSTQDKYFRKAPSRQIDAWQPAAQSTSTSVDFERDSETGVEKVSPIDASTGTRKGAGSHYGEGDSQWLLGLCRDFTSSHVHEFPALRLAEELHKICVDSRNNSARLENSLIELLGFDGVEFMMEVVSNRDRIAEAELGSSKVWDHVDNDIDDDAKIAHELSMMNMSYDQQDDSVDMESMSANQRRKLVQKREKERAEMEAQYTKGAPDWLRNAGFSEEYLTEERALGLEKFKPRTIEDRWLDGLAPEGTTESRGPQKLGLPAGTKREYGQGWEEVHIPAAKKKEQMKPEDHVDISSLESWAQKAFEGTKCLNTIQTTVYKTAYQSTENMLVCAPTGAGKTNIAMLTFLQLLKQNIEAGELNKEAVKAIYVAPMKALAQEVVAKFSERLKPLGLVVKEYTGDMQLTKAEIIESQMLVTTPEKYDVITRKGGDGSLMTMVSLIIIDEVHLLADERGAVIETIVARTQRYVESSQKQVRIVGLSATLPNYKDVAKFLGVNNKSCYFFGPEYRPVPLDQTFIGLTEKSRVKLKNQMAEHAYHKMVSALERGKQVMIFVHSRKETSGTAQQLQELVAKYNTSALLDNSQHENYNVWKRAVDRSRSKEVQNLFAAGMGMHHAGMLRADRTLTEQLFESGMIKLLCCTATLAWGVNLPAHTVIIKGTELYDPERGGFVDLSILDVLQIFGRAGRPQYAETGHAILITPHKSLNKYLGMLGQQAPIESNFIKALADHLNAEVVNGTVSNIAEASTWISYTFLFIRMRANPLAYGMTQEDIWEDPQLNNKRVQLVKDAATILDQNLMLRYDVRSGNLGVTDLGRIASHYYIKHGTIEGFNNMLNDAQKSEKECLHALCSASEFDQLKVRPEETAELERLKKAVPMKTKSIDDTAGKVSVLLQQYCRQERVESFTLQSDTNYIAQNAGRIARALFEINRKRGWSSMARLYLEMAKSIDRRVNMHDTPLRQFNELSRDVIHRIETTNSTPERIIEMDPTAIGVIIHNQKAAKQVLRLANRLPHLYIDATVKPITRGILRIVLEVYIDFQWDTNYHGFAEPFHIWIEDGENETIYHSEFFLAKKKQHDSKDVAMIEFTIPITEPIPAQYYVRVVSDRWVGCESCIAVSFQHLILPERMPPHTPLLDIHPVPTSALCNRIYESLYKSFTHFNPVQSQTFHTLYHSDKNVLIGAPTGSGKTITAELAILHLLKTRPESKAIYVAPMKALARERLYDWQRKFGKRGFELNVLELTGDASPDARALREGNILIVTPEKWDSISRSWQSKNREYVRQVELVILDEVHLLGVDRGPVLEMIVSRMRFIAAQMNRNVRFVGLSTALANPRDLADWLGIDEVGVYNFRPSVRPVPMTIHIQGFPEKNYCPRMASMNKPCYAAIMEHSPTKPTLIFVASRRQTRLTALDLIAYCAADLDKPKRFLNMTEDETISITETIRDGALRDTIAFGVGIHHAGLDNYDRLTVEKLFLSNKIQVLVCTSTLAWGVNLPCHLVIVKGTEFYDGKINRYVDMPVTDVLQMMGRAGRPQFDDSAVAVIMAHEPKKNFYKKFLHEPFPVESSLHNYLHDHLNAEIANGTLHNLEDCIEFLTWTYYFRRLVYNPSYYSLVDASPEGVRTHLIDMIKTVVFDLQAGKCLDCFDDEGKTIQSENDRDEVENAKSNTENDTILVKGEKQKSQMQMNFHLKPTRLGTISSYYYLHYKTVGHFENKIQELELGDWSSAETASEDLVKELTWCICQSSEFSELPVRHNEEGLNKELAKDLPWSVIQNESEYESPHVKAFLLLQAHFCKAGLPISDYINDTKSVLDQVPRVLGALLEVAVMKENHYVIESLSVLSQMISQGCMFGESDLMQLPYSSQNVVSYLEHHHQLIHLNQLKSQVSIDQILEDQGLQALLHNQNAWSKFSFAIRSFPLPQISSVHLVSGYSNGKLLKLDSRECITISEAMATECKKPLYSESSDLSYTNITLRVEVQDQCTQTGGARQLRNGRHHKPKQAGWWLVVTYEKKGSQMKPALGAFKRVPLLTRLIDVTIEKVPVNTELHFKIQLLSDTYHKGGTSGIISINISRNCTNRN